MQFKKNIYNLLLAHKYPHKPLPLPWTLLHHYLSILFQLLQHIIIHILKKHPSLHLTIFQNAKPNNNDKKTISSLSSRSSHIALLGPMYLVLHILSQSNLLQRGGFRSQTRRHDGCHVGVPWRVEQSLQFTQTRWHPRAAREVLDRKSRNLQWAMFEPCHLHNNSWHLAGSFSIHLPREFFVLVHL